MERMIIRFLLSVIAVCLVMITAKLYIPEAKAQVADMGAYDLFYDPNFKKAVGLVVSDYCSVRVRTYADVDSGQAYVSFTENVDCN